LIWNFFLLGMLRDLSLRPILRWWLVRRGVRATGVVDNVVHTDGKSPQVTVTATFTPVGGLAPLTSTLSVTPVQFQQAAVGETVTIFHHRTRPTWNVIYELSPWEIVGGD
jgi:hypothetical protein